MGHGLKSLGAMFDGSTLSSFFKDDTVARPGQKRPRSGRMSRTMKALVPAGAMENVASHGKERASPDVTCAATASRGAQRCRRRRAEVLRL